MEFILGDRVYEVRFLQDGDFRTAVVTVTLDGSHVWSLTGSGWGAVSLGVSGEIGYLWTARELAVLPLADDSDLGVIVVDEDLIAVFRLDDGWLAVCETSVRRFVDNVETSRIELGEVIETSRWEGEVLLIRDFADKQYALRVDGERLIV